MMSVLSVSAAEEAAGIVVVPYCGDGNIDSPNHGGIYEECDGSNLDGETCESLLGEYYEGDLACVPFGSPTPNPDRCQFDTSGCHLEECKLVIDEPEIKKISNYLKNY